jgi:hypothetical protein
MSEELAPKPSLYSDDDTDSDKELSPKPKLFSDDDTDSDEELAPSRHCTVTTIPTVTKSTYSSCTKSCMRARHLHFIFFYNFFINAHVYQHVRRSVGGKERKQVPVANALR